jgi:F-type H+-transporting ATPase subunit delta
MPTQVDDVAKVYAQSLLELALAKGAEVPAAVGEELDALCEAARADARFREFLASPMLERAEREASLKRILEGKASDLLVKFVLVLNRKGRLGHLLEIGDAFDQLLQDRFGKVEVDVYTVGGGALPDEVAGAVKARVKGAFGKEAVLHSYRDAGMIGGIKLRIGDQLIDGSVATRLRRMQAAMLDAARADLAAKPERFIDGGSGR